MTSFRVAVVGAGHIGQMIARNFLLDPHQRYTVTMIDQDPDRLSAFRQFSASLIACHTCPSDRIGSTNLLHDQDAVINALPFHASYPVAEAAKASRTHYFDLNEDMATTRAIQALAADAETMFMPQCGLAPGFIGIVAHDLAQRFATVDSLRLRVGALPEHASNRLKYNLTWNVDGLVNEYCHPCDALREGRLCQVAPLEGLEHFSIDGVEYEAFNTAGGLSSLCESLLGRVQTLDYKTIRYPGHRDLMQFLLDDLKFRDDRPALIEVLRRAVPATTQDLVLVWVAATGRTQDGRFCEKVLSWKVRAVRQPFPATAIQRTTAAGACVAVDLLREGRLPTRGFVRQESIDLDTFLANPYAQVYQETGRLG